MARISSNSGILYAWQLIIMHAYSFIYYSKQSECSGQIFLQQLQHSQQRTRLLDKVNGPCAIALLKMKWTLTSVLLKYSPHRFQALKCFDYVFV